MRSNPCEGNDAPRADRRRSADSGAERVMVRQFHELIASALIATTASAKSAAVMSPRQFGNVRSQKSARHNALGRGFFDSPAEVGGDPKYFRGRADSFAGALA